MFADTRWHDALADDTRHLPNDFVSVYVLPDPLACVAWRVANNADDNDVFGCVCQPRCLLCCCLSQPHCLLCLLKFACPPPPCGLRSCAGHRYMRTLKHFEWTSLKHSVYQKLGENTVRACYSAVRSVIVGLFNLLVELVLDHACVGAVTPTTPSHVQPTHSRKKKIKKRNKYDRPATSRAYGARKTLS